MDPDQLLDDILEVAGKINDAADEPDVCRRPPDVVVTGYAEELAAKVHDLDSWLTRGGYLPAKQSPQWLHPAGGHTRHRDTRFEPEQLQEAVGHHHRRQDSALSASLLQKRLGDHHGADRAQFA